MKTIMKSFMKINELRPLKIWSSAVQLMVLSLVLLLSQLTLAKDRIQYHVQNFDGSTLKVINDQGVVSQSYQYAPFGQQLQYKKPSNLKNPNAFVGGIQDAGDLVYLKARHYNPVLGRFYQPDPVTFIMKGHGQTNRYQYGWNDSYTFGDSNGLYTSMWDTIQYGGSIYGIGNYDIHSEKIQFVQNNKFAILSLSAEYKLPAILLAGVAYNEYGGDPSQIDNIAWLLRAGNKISVNLIGYESIFNSVAKDPGLTSVGDTSVQLRHFSGDSLITQAKNLYMVNGMGKESTERSLQNSAVLLRKIANNLYPQSNGFNKQEMINILHQYNGPGKNTYGENVFKNSRSILDALR